MSRKKLEPTATELVETVEKRASLPSARTKKTLKKPIWQGKTLHAEGESVSLNASQIESLTKSGHI